MQVWVPRGAKLEGDKLDVLARRCRQGQILDYDEKDGLLQKKVG